MINRVRLKQKGWIGLSVMYLLFVGFFLSAVEAQELSRGQLVYVPIYSHIYYGDREKAFLLTATLSVRNTDPGQPISLLRVDYFNTEGKLVRKYLSKPVTLGPMQSIRYIVKASNTTGGSGANFLIQWKSETEVNLPILEGIMIGTAMGQGISFTSRGQAIREK